MNFRSVADLNECVVRNLARIPTDITAIVGVPRSGLLAGSLIALHLNLPLLTLSDFLEGRAWEAGLSRPQFLRTSNNSEPKVLIVDDSVGSGAQMESVRARVASSERSASAIYAAVYVAPEKKGAVDLYFEVCPHPRIFEWNLMHHSFLQSACVDIDGVLCVDPKPEENDDGPRYLNFLQNATPLLVPSAPVGALVTCRLEKYRTATELWLEGHGIRYGALHMLDLPDKESRMRWGKHGEYKGEIYRRSGNWLFIESSQLEAPQIAKVSGKPVLCVETRRMVPIPAVAKAGATLERRSRGILRRIKSVLTPG